MSFRNSKTFAKVVSIPHSKVLFGTFRVRFLSPAFAQPSQSNIKIYTWTWIQLFLHLCRWFLNWSNSMKYGKHECRLSEQTAWADQPVGSNSSNSRSSCSRSTSRSRTSRSSSTSRGSKSNMSSSAVSNRDSWESQLCFCISTFAVRLSSPFKQSSEETTQPQRCALRLDMVMCSVLAVWIAHAGEFKTPW